MIGVMRYAHIRSGDLNLLVNFLVLMEERSVTRAAAKAFLSQPAMSRVFHRLQELLSDELLVRTAKGYEPTTRALAVYAKLEQLLPEIESLLRAREFRAAESKDLFRIGAIHRSFWLLPAIISTVVRTAPNVQLEITPWNHSFEELESNATDLVLASLPPPPHLRSQLLLKDKLACLVRADHPIAQNSLTLARYVECQHLAVSVTQTKQRLVDDALAKLGRQRDVRVQLPSFAGVDTIVGNTDLVATLPLGAARDLARTPRVRVIPAPPEIGLFAYYQIWHPRNDADAAQQWLRASVRASCLEEFSKLRPSPGGRPGRAKDREH